jgi:hypothetical protein
MKRPIAAIVAVVVALSGMVAQSVASVSVVLDPSQNQGSDTSGLGGNETLNDPADPATLVDYFDGCWRSVGQPAVLRMGERFNTIAGQEYVLTYLVAGIGSSVRSDLARVMINGTTRAATPSGSSPLVEGHMTSWWTTERLSFAAVSSETTVTFQTGAISGLTPMVRDISLSSAPGVAVPEPSMIIVWLLLGAASWVGMSVRRRG